MNKEIKQKWINALLSGRYKQNNRELVSFADSEVDSLCCLGVLNDISDLGIWNASDQAYIAEDLSGEFNWNEEFITHPLVAEWAEISRDPKIDLTNIELSESIKDNLSIKSLIYNNTKKTKAYISELNDAGITFEQLAQIIQEQL